MQLAIVDPQAKFSCHACSKCCTQPWAILIEREKIAAIQGHDFSKYPQLSGRKWFTESKDVAEQFLVVAKQEGSTRCLFLDQDGLCIIHKELGMTAKPVACQKFPYLVAEAPDGYRVSLHYGCPNAQTPQGVPLTEQLESIESTCAELERSRDLSIAVRLSGEIHLSADEWSTCIARLETIFQQSHVSVWQMFDESLQMLSAEIAARQPQLGSGAVEPSAGGLKTQNPAATPGTASFSRPVRMLFAANMMRDVVPASVTINLSLWGRIRLLPQLMKLMKLSGAYDSKVLDRRIDIDRVLAHPIDGITAAAHDRLASYLRARIWQRWLIGVRRSVVAGLHQHILDVNAVLFVARALAEHQGERVLSERTIADALSRVEFNIANQTRAFDHPALGFLTGLLDHCELALQSLEMMRQPVVSPTTTSPIINVAVTGLPGTLIDNTLTQFT